MVWRLTRSYRWVRNRIDELEEVLQHSERFILVFGFVEKLVRRTFVHICTEEGMSEEQAVAESKKSSLMKLNSRWRGRTGQTLRNVIGKDAWTQLHQAAELRNELIHGGGHRDQRVYKRTVKGLLEVLDDLGDVFFSEYGFDGWKRRK